MAKTSDTLKKATSSAMAYPFSLRTAIMELFDIGPWVAFTVLALATAAIIAAAVYFVRSAPPRTLVITSGPENTMNFRQAQRYAKILAKNGVKVEVLPSKGSVENLEWLKDPKQKIDLGIVQSGAMATKRAFGRSETISELNPEFDDLVSLGSIAYQPLFIFYRGPKIDYLSALAGKRIAVGPEGSGTRNISLAVLGANGIKEEEKNATLVALDAEEAAEQLEQKKLDAAFMMGESASGKLLRGLMRSGDVKLYSFKQASAYARKFDYLNRLELPEGSIDIGKNIPPHDVTLLAPTTELIARKDIHPALVDLILEAATEVHSRPTTYQKRGEFPAPVQHSIRLSDDANVYYKSGKSFLYRALPFWLASVLSRIVVVFVPLLIIMIPTIRAVPAFFRWISQLKIRRRYRQLRLLEQDFLNEKNPERKDALRREFDRIEDDVNTMRVRASFAHHFYALRAHIDYVRRIVEVRR